MINKIIMFFLRKIIKKNSCIKTELIDFLNDEYFEELKTVVKSKENKIKQKEFNDYKRNKAFKDVKPGDVVIAKSLNPGSREEENPHLYRPFFILGRSKKHLYGLYSTTKPQKGKEYYSLNFSGSEKTSYLSCSRIIRLSFDDFKCPSKYSVHCDDAKKIINKMLNYNHNYSQIDFKSFFKKVTFNSIVLCNNKLYKISGISKTGYEAYPLWKAKDYNNASRCVIIFGKKYTINENKKFILKPDEIIVITDVENYRAYEEDNRLKQEKSTITVGDKYVKNYKYGDVLSLKNTKNKIIYITESRRKIYYVTYDDLDLFKGICSIDKSSVVACYNHLSDYEINKLNKKINKVLGTDDDKNLSYVDLDKKIPATVISKK